MLNTLLASQAPRTRTGPAQFLSLIVHGALVSGAVMATPRAAAVIAEPETVVIVPTFRPDEPEPAAPLVNVARIKGFRLLPALMDIPSALPEIDLSRPFTNSADFLDARGVPGADPAGTRTLIATETMTVDQVDRQAFLMAGSGRPAYPDALRSAGVEGEVIVEFVIDTLGRADLRTLKVVATTHERFTESATRALAKARFVPAEYGGRKVRQVVRMPFVFSLEKR